MADVDGPGLLTISPEVSQDASPLVEGGRREPTFNAMILPVKERVVQVKFEEPPPPPPVVVEPPPPSPPPPPPKPKKQKAEIVVPVEKTEREMPSMKPREELPEEWMKRMCDDTCEEEAAKAPPAPPAPQTKINLPIVILALCAGYGIWHATRSIMSAVKSAPECAASVAVDV